MADRWKRSQMAANYQDYDVDVELNMSSEAIVIDGMTVGASFGGDAGEIYELDMLPASYFRRFASARPLGREGAYDPYEIRPQPEPRDRGNDVTPATLQREIRVRSSGHGSGGGRKRATTGGKVGPEFEQKRARGGDDDELHLGRHFVYGLTRGETEFYAGRRGEARTVLQHLAARIWVERTPPEPQKTKQVGRPLPNFPVYGLSDTQREILTKCRGAARAALVDYAHQQDHARIAARDARDAAAPTPGAAPVAHELLVAV